MSADINEVNFSEYANAAVTDDPTPHLAKPDPFRRAAKIGIGGAVALGTGLLVTACTSTATETHTPTPTSTIDGCVITPGASADTSSATTKGHVVGAVADTNVDSAGSNNECGPNGLPTPTLTDAERQQILENNATTVAFAKKVMQNGIDSSLTSDNTFKDTQHNNASIPDGTVVYTDNRGNVVDASHAFYAEIKNAEDCGAIIDPTTGNLVYALIAVKDSNGQTAILLLHPDLQSNETITVGVEQKTSAETGIFGSNTNISAATFASIMESPQIEGTAVNLKFDASTATWVGSNPNNNDTFVNYIRQLVKDGNQAAVRTIFQQLATGDTGTNLSIIKTLDELNSFANNPNNYKGIGPMEVDITSTAGFVPMQ